MVDDDELAAYRDAYRHLLEENATPAPSDDELAALVTGELEGDARDRVTRQMLQSQEAIEKHQILQQLHRQAASRLPPRQRWPRVAGVAAVLGVAVTVALYELRSPPEHSGADGAALTIPVTAVTRSEGDPTTTGRDLPVSEAEPQLWLEYIQELVYNGELAEAEQHIRAFRQMHPDYRYTP